jgi:hypothetical protein
MTPRGFVLVVLGIIVGIFGASAVIRPWTKPFSTVLALTAAVLFVLVLISRLDFRLPARPQHPSSQRRKQTGVILVGASMSLIVGIVAVAPWVPRADFDVTGLLWMMQNIVPILLLGILVTGSIVGLALWRGH